MWTCWDIFYDFSQASSFAHSTAVFSATFCRDLLLQPLNPYHIISAVTALPSYRPARGCVSCVMSIYLSIDLSVQLLPGLLQYSSSCCWLRPIYRCYTIELAATSQPNVFARRAFTPSLRRGHFHKLDNIILLFL